MYFHVIKSFLSIWLFSNFHTLVVIQIKFFQQPLTRPWLLEQLCLVDYNIAILKKTYHKCKLFTGQQISMADGLGRVDFDLIRYFLLFFGNLLGKPQKLRKAAELISSPSQSQAFPRFLFRVILKVKVFSLKSIFGLPHPIYGIF